MIRAPRLRLALAAATAAAIPIVAPAAVGGDHPIVVERDLGRERR